ncbi:MAG: futalosine nucleosidase [Acidobacteria bacterium]|nr:futalosine nucleosidase [Acidobacteriota bacterium]
MRILIVAATDPEVAQILGRMYSTPTEDPCVDTYTHGAHEIDVLITGVGMVATASWCSRTLTQTTYDLALNLGICGSFDEFIEPGTVVHVVSDRLAELGAEDGDRFLTLEELELPGECEFVNLDPPSNPEIDQLPAVAGITVNTVHGHAPTIAAVSARFRPQVESMEGAAFMSACLMHRVQFAQVRAVSNLVERRNRESWRMADAIRNLSVSALRIIDQS